LAIYYHRIFARCRNRYRTRNKTHHFFHHSERQAKIKLKKASFGVQRFSLFEQLAEEHIKKGDTDSILKYGNLYEKELANWDKNEQEKNHHYAKAHYIMGVGNVFNGLLEKSTEWYIKGIQAAERANFLKYEYKNKVGLAKITNRALISLGTAHLKKQEYEKATNYYNQAFKMAVDFKDLEMELTVGLEQAKLAEALDDLGKAFTDYEDIRERALKEGFTALYFEGSLLLAKLYYKEGMYETANIALSFAYINAVDRENLEFQKDALSVQARCFAKLEDYKNAYAVITQLFGVVGAKNSQQQRAIIKELEIEYETLEKEKEIIELEEGNLKREAELKRQKTIKNAFLIGFLIILIPVMALLYVYYQKIQAQTELTKKQEEINRQKVAALVQEQELNLIKASIEGQDEERKRIAR